MTDREKVIEDLQDAVNDDWMWQHADFYARTMEKAIQLLKAQPQWISVKDRLPKSKPDDLEYPTVIIALSDGSVELGCYYESTHEWGAGEYFDRPRNPVAWIPLPEPPKGVK